MKSRSVMSSRRRRALGAGLSVLVGVGTVLTLGPPAVAAGTSYVALGDSYSSGVGAGGESGSNRTALSGDLSAVPVTDAAGRVVRVELPGQDIVVQRAE